MCPCSRYELGKGRTAIHGDCTCEDRNWLLEKSHEEHPARQKHCKDTYKVCKLRQSPRALICLHFLHETVQKPDASLWVGKFFHIINEQSAMYLASYIAIHFHILMQWNGSTARPYED